MSVDLDKLERLARRVLELHAGLGPLHSSLAETGEGAAALELFRAAVDVKTVLALLVDQRKLRAALTEALNAWERHSFRGKLAGGRNESTDHERIAKLRKEFGL